MTKRHLVYIAVSLGGVIFGYNTTAVSAHLDILDSVLRVVPESLEETLITTVLLFGAAVGALITGVLVDKIGRKRMLSTLAVFSILASISVELIDSYLVFLLVRLVLGIAVGGFSVAVPVYLSEVAPLKRRGKVIYLNQVFIALGVLLGYSINSWLVSSHLNSWNSSYGWKIGLVLAVIPSVILALCLVFVPESPRYLIKIGKVDAAKKTLLSFDIDENEIDESIVHITKSFKRKGKTASAFAKRVRPGLVMAIGLAILQQAIGVNAVVYYVPRILRESGVDYLGQQWISISVFALGFFATVAGVFLVEKLPRKRWLIIGAVILAADLALFWVISLVFGQDQSSAWGLILALLIVFVVVFNLTWGAQY
ncbi:putative metabolite transport protein CsbC [Actinomycetota bacterium]|nr:putative metabolite transport protein CsbC [Actinomycetota bacterium]